MSAEASGDLKCPDSHTPPNGHIQRRVIEAPFFGADFEPFPDGQKCCKLYDAVGWPCKIDTWTGERPINLEDIHWFWDNILQPGSLHGRWVIPPTGSSLRLIVHFETFQLFIRNDSAYEIRFVANPIFTSAGNLDSNLLNLTCSWYRLGDIDLREILCASLSKSDGQPDMTAVGSIAWADIQSPSQEPCNEDLLGHWGLLSYLDIPTTDTNSFVYRACSL